MPSTTSIKSLVLLLVYLLTFREKLLLVSSSVVKNHFENDLNQK